jgi:hypothetical protein
MVAWGVVALLLSANHTARLVHGAFSTSLNGHTLIFTPRLDLPCLVWLALLPDFMLASDVRGMERRWNGGGMGRRAKWKGRWENVLDGSEKTLKNASGGRVPEASPFADGVSGEQLLLSLPSSMFLMLDILT